MKNSMVKKAPSEQKLENLTPMMAQYMAVKEEYPDCLVFYRMGDFYELFMDDAIAAAATLDITLTKRSSKGDDIPMCGVPWHSHEAYLAKLIRNGFKVAICEQVETADEAKARGGYKALVKRDVVRVVTQGTLTEDTLLDSHTNNYLATLADTGGAFGIAWLDLSTGDFTLQPVLQRDLGATLERINPGEILISDKTSQNPAFFDVFSTYKSKLTIQPHSRFDSENARKRLEKLFGVATLESFGGFSRAEVTAAGTLIDYVELTQKGKVPRLSAPRQLSLGSIMEIDASTRRNLELNFTLNGARQGSLLHSIDFTVTGAGARLLARQLSLPLTNPEHINTRLDMVEWCIENPDTREDIRQVLKRCTDMERCLARLSLERGSPRDMAAVRDTLKHASELFKFLDENKLPTGLATAKETLKTWGSHHPLIDHLERALAKDLPMLARDGSFIAEGYSPQLDKLRSLRTDGHKHIARLQEEYSRETGVSSLKIKHNNVIGYFIEATTAHADKLLAKPDNFIHRQTMANAARFTTVALTELERHVSESAEKALAIELELFKVLTAEILAEGEAIALTAEALAQIDVTTSLAELAIKSNYTRPVVDNSLIFDIKGGRHPVVESALKKQSNTDFIPNNCSLNDNSHLWLLTGPNMAGKSTFLRQNALIALLAQTGSYVPAESARIGVIDRLFSRVGASDDLARGHSTFMVEMVETATILNQSTNRSLVILDEIGRGTATFDGLSIAWACLEYLHEHNKCRALFATHYHELTSLTERLQHMSCHSMQVKEWNDTIVFLHEVAEGTADRSYGIHVAKLAGLPAAVIVRAEEVLKSIESEKKPAALAADLPLFSVKNIEAKAQHLSAVEEALKGINPDTLSPKEALDTLYALKEITKQ